MRCGVQGSGVVAGQSLFPGSRDAVLAGVRSACRRCPPGVRRCAGVCGPAGCVGGQERRGGGCEALRGALRDVGGVCVSGVRAWSWCPAERAPLLVMNLTCSASPHGACAHGMRGCAGGGGREVLGRAGTAFS